LKELAASIRSPDVQQALHRAQDSLASDATGINSNFRRENRKRRWESVPRHVCASIDSYFVRRPPSPASPQPYVARPAREPSAFPPADANEAPLTAQDLLGYIGEHNRERRTKLQIWLKTVGEAKSDRPKLLRFMIPDVVIVYITISYERTGGVVLIENLAAFGPREKVGPSTAASPATATDSSAESPPPAVRVHGVPKSVTTVCAGAAFQPQYCISESDGGCCHCQIWPSTHISGMAPFQFVF
jgi:hypothetical protein